MSIDSNTIREILSGKGLKVTPQRTFVLKAIYSLNNHPTAEQIIDYIKQHYPNVSTGTVYNVLDTLVKSELVRKVKTEKDIMRYDGIIENHHHLYCIECDYIDDYINPELDALLNEYFTKNNIENFVIEDIRLQINGRFIKHKNV